MTTKSKQPSTADLKSMTTVALWRVVFDGDQYKNGVRAQAMRLACERPDHAEAQVIAIGRRPINTSDDLVNVRNIIDIAAEGGITLTSVEIRGLANMTPNKAASVIAELVDAGQIRFSLSVGGFVPGTASE